MKEDNFFETDDWAVLFYAVVALIFMIFEVIVAKQEYTAPWKMMVALAVGLVVVLYTIVFLGIAVYFWRALAPEKDYVTAIATSGLCAGIVVIIQLLFWGVCLSKMICVIIAGVVFALIVLAIPVTAWYYSRN